MDETLRQLGGLLLGSIPTIVLLLFTFIAYRALVHSPLERVLLDRRRRTQGAIEQARADIAAAEAKAAEYEQRLREARLAVFKTQEARRKLALEARAQALAEARAHAQQQVKATRAALEREKEIAMEGLKGEAQKLAQDIIRAILRPATAAQPPVVGGRS